MEKQDYLKMYQEMVIIRRLEEKAAELYQQGKIGGFLHLYIGQEAVSTGLISVRMPEDRVITAYRDHGVAINCGLSSRNPLGSTLLVRLILQVIGPDVALKLSGQFRPQVGKG